MKNSPVWHAIRSFPSMILEGMLAPFQYYRQETDWSKLCQRFPGLENFRSHQAELITNLCVPYEDYISNVSSSLITLSLNRAAFLYFFADLIMARSILDLGSGFSSYVFRRFEGDLSSEQVVTTVDDASYWLERTKDFLQKHHVSTDRMLDLKKFLAEEGKQYDLCFLDMGDLSARMHILPFLHSTFLKNGTLLLVDDLHVPAYRRHLEQFCKKHNLRLYSLRKMTRRKLSHMGLIMQNPKHEWTKK